jgi:hypothetical protein
MRDHDVHLPDPGLTLHLPTAGQRLTDGATSGTRLPTRMKTRLVAFDIPPALQLQISVLTAVLLRLVLPHALANQSLVLGFVALDRPTGRIPGLPDHPLTTLLGCHALSHGRSSQRRT